MEELRRSNRLVLCLSVLVIGVGGFAWLRSTRPDPPRRVSVSRVPRVEVMAVEPVTFAPPVIGYGNVRPKRQVKIVPEVGGRLVKVHQDFAVGNLIPEGELLFEIDSRVYRAKVRQVEAEIVRLETELRRHAQTRLSLSTRLTVAREQAELALKQFESDQRLHREGGVPGAELDLTRQHYLKRKDAVLAIENQLALVPLQVQETEALLETKRARLTEATLNVEKTRILCPFDARVDVISAQTTQVVIAGFDIATLTDMAALEIPIVIDPRELQWTDARTFARAVGDDVVNAPEARVTWTLHGRVFSWTGTVTRLERLDEATRSAHVIVEIRDIMRGLETAEQRGRLPLSVGMFCRGELPAEPLEDALVVPRHALHEGRFIYVFEPDPDDPRHGRLAIRSVPVLRGVGDEILVAYRGRHDRAEGASSANPSGAAAQLQVGDLVVLSPMSRVVEGMPLSRGDAVETVASRGAALSVRVAEARAASAAPLLGAVTGVR